MQRMRQSVSRFVLNFLCLVHIAFVIRTSGQGQAVLGGRRARSRIGIESILGPSQPFPRRNVPPKCGSSCLVACGTKVWVSSRALLPRTSTLRLSGLNCFVGTQFLHHGVCVRAKANVVGDRKGWQTHLSVPFP